MGCLCCCCKKDEEEVKKGLGYVSSEERGCTDVLCCLLFVVFWIGMIVIGVVGLIKGQPYALVYGVDYEGNICGIDQYEDRPLTAFPRLIEDALYNSMQIDPLDYRFYGVCAASCPKAFDVLCNYDGETLVSNWETTNDCELANTDLRQCWDDPTATHFNATCGASYVESRCKPFRQVCWINAVPTTNVLYRCVPQYSATANVDAECVYPETVTDAEDPACIVVEENHSGKVRRPAKTNYLFEQLNDAQQTWGRYFADLQTGADVIFYTSILFAVALSFLFVIFLSFFTGFIVYTIIVLSIVGTIGITFYSYWKAGIIKNETLDTIGTQLEKAAAAAIGSDTSSSSSQFMPESERLAQQADDQAAWEVYAYVFTGLSIILLALVLALRKQIQTAVRTITLAAKAVLANILIMVYPLIPVTALTAIFLWWVYVAAALFTAGEITVADVGSAIDEQIAAVTNNASQSQGTRDYFEMLATSNSSSLEYYQTEDVFMYLFCYHLLGLLWTAQFIQGIAVMTISGTVYGWYFSRNNDVQDVLDKVGAFKEPAGSCCQCLIRNTLCFCCRPRAAAPAAAAGGDGPVQNDASASSAQAGGMDLGKGCCCVTVDNDRIESCERRCCCCFACCDTRPLCRSMRWALWYHSGTVAIGALLIAIVQFIRIVVAYIQRQLRKAKDNPVVQYIMCAIQSCLACVEFLLKMVTRNAFMFTSLKGMGFWPAAGKALGFIIGNMMTFAVVNALSSLLMLTGKLFVCACCALVAAWSISGDEYAEGGDKELSSFWLIPSVVFLLAFFIATAFFGTFDIVIDSMLIAYTTDREESKAHGSGPMHAKLRRADVDVDDALGNLDKEFTEIEAESDAQQGGKPETRMNPAANSQVLQVSAAGSGAAAAAAE